MNLSTPVRSSVLAGLLLFGLCAAGTASAQSIEDRLRAQLRETTEQLRQLQDGDSQLHTDLSTAQQQRDQALAQLKDAQAELAAAKGKSAGEITAEHELAAEKTSHAQDSQQLAKYKSAYEDLLTLSHSHDAQSQTALKAGEAQLQTCEAKNVQLYQVGHEILNAYEHVDLGTVLHSREPFAQSARVKYDTIAQQYGDTLYEGKYDPRATRPAAAAAAPASAPAAN
ncbi:MAG TPA: hypothetical protein VGG24_20110 [Paraburkholderia sp.]|jgi:uncharacterized protein (DUF3084 family)